MALLIVFFFVSILFSFLCSIWEAVLLSIPPSAVQLEAEKGTRTGQLLTIYKEKIDRPLSAILTLNTIAHTVGAIGVGQQAGKIWGETFTATIVVPIIMTLAILILSEIIPKTLGANFWKSLMGFTVRSLNIIIIALYPLVLLSQAITGILKKDKERSVFSRSEFQAMARIGERDGVFMETESKIIQNLLRLNTILTRDIMSPRTVLKMAEENTSIQHFFEANPDLRFSRIPTYEHSQDQITGFILKDELLTNIIRKNPDAPLKSIRRDILFVKGDMDLPDLFNHLMEKREHIAIVIGEFGGVEGLVTMEDVIETLLGTEIMDELDNIEDMRLLARKNWEKRARKLGLIQSNPSEENEE